MMPEWLSCWNQLTTRVGTITLRGPRIRNGKFSTELFARYQRSEQALVLAMRGHRCLQRTVGARQPPFGTFTL